MPTLAFQGKINVAAKRRPAPPLQKSTLVSSRRMSLWRQGLPEEKQPPQNRWHAINCRSRGHEVFCAEGSFRFVTKVRFGKWDWHRTALPQTAISPLEAEFYQLANQWYRDTRKVSSLHEIILHPAYQQIIGMGKPVLPFIFKELRTRRGHWLWALNMIIRRDHAKPGQNFRQAVDEWLRWAGENGYSD